MQFFRIILLVTLADLFSHCRERSYIAYILLAVLDYYPPPAFSICPGDLSPRALQQDPSSAAAALLCWLFRKLRREEGGNKRLRTGAARSAIPRTYVRS